MKRKLNGLHCLLYAAVGLAVFFFAAYQFGLFTASTAVKVLEALSNAFIMPGVLLAGVGAISWTGSLGTYDMLGYGMQTFFSLWRRGKHAKSFYDYRQAKEEKGRTWFPEMLIVGLAYILLSIIALVISMVI